MKPLLICPPPFKDESFGGYILRLTELNLYPSPNYIYKWVRTNQRIAKNPYKINPKDTDIKNLAILLNSTEKLLWSMLVPFYKITATNPKKIREKYMTSTFAKYFSLSNKVCVKCLVENSYIKKYWDIFMVTVCPEHLCYLVDECPKCKKKLKYNRKKVDECICGLDLKQIKPVYLENFQDANLNYSVLNACGFQNKELTTGNPLNSTNLDELVDSVLTTARLLNNDKYISSPKSAVIDIHGSLLQSYKLFENWPLHYYEALERLQTEGNRREKKGILRFGQFYQAVFGKESKHNNQHLNFLREGFESYLKSVWVDGNVGLLKHIDDNNIRYVTLNKASEILHKTEETIKKLLENKVLKGVIKQYNSTNLYLVEKNSIEEYKKLEKDPFIKVRKNYNELENFITKIDLERFLLISETTIKELVLAGVFNPVSGPEIDGNHIRVYKKEELYNFFSTLNSKVKKELNTNNKDLVTFHEARKLINCHFSDFITYVLNNEITVVKVNSQDVEESIKHYYFFKTEVLKKIKQEINGLNGLELSSLLMVSKASITNWIRNGFFTFELKKGKKVIRYSDVDLFKQTYIPLTHIPFFNKNDSNAVIKLRNQGILPVSGYSKDGGIGYLYLKKEIEKILGSNIDW